jgi:hypothetical protein
MAVLSSSGARHTPLAWMAFLYRLCYVRGPEGIIVERAEQIG